MFFLSFLTTYFIFLIQFKILLTYFHSFFNRLILAFIVCNSIVFIFMVFLLLLLPLGRVLNLLLQSWRWLQNELPIFSLFFKGKLFILLYLFQYWLVVLFLFDLKLVDFYEAYDRWHYIKQIAYIFNLVCILLHLKLNFRFEFLWSLLPEKIHNSCLSLKNILVLQLHVFPFLYEFLLGLFEIVLNLHHLKICLEIVQKVLCSPFVQL